MKFYFYSPISFEPWDWRNSVEKGIGGSETSHVEMAWRLVRRGHEVITYANIPKDCPGEWLGTKWYPLEKATFKEPGVWVLYRCPEIVDKFDHKRKDQQLWLMMQDWDYPQWNGKDGERRIKNTDRVITLCQAHGEDVVTKHPLIKKNLWLSSNGVKIDLIEEVEKKNIKRNPLKIIHTSSPDRGLRNLLLIFPKAREYVPDLELHAFYGFNNLKKLAKKSKGFKDTIEEIEKLLKQPGVYFHGRTTQTELYEQWLSSGIWCYPTNFSETSCISSMEAQCMGAIPVFSPKYALSENVKHGIAIDGNAEDPLTRARFAAELVRIALAPDLQDVIRKEMIPWARNRFTWEVFVDQWIMEAEGKRKEFEKQYPFPVQL